MVMKENMWRQRRLAVPKRTSELVALVALSSTLFLFLHTRDLHSRLREMEVRLQPGEGETLSGNQLSSEDGHSGHTGYTGPATNAPMLSQNMQKQTSVKLKSSEIDDKILDNNEDAGNIQMVGVDKSKRMLYFKSSWDENLQRLYASPPQTEIHTSAAVDSKPESFFLIFYPNKTVIILGNKVGRLAMALKITLTGTPHRFLIPAIIFLDNRRSSLGTIDKPLEESLDIDALNNTRRADKHVLFFNRVPKVGSQTFMQLLRLLSLRNGFSFNTDRVQRVETIRLSTYEQRQLVRLVNSYPEPSVYIKHVCFTNFTQFNLPRPIYMNVVRDPVERVISWYYYVRAPWYYVERKILFPELALPDPAWLKKDFETCVLAGDRECRYIEGESNESLGDHRRQTLFFCGHGEKCTPFNTVGALERAKLSVEKDYAVVGVLEDMNTTLAVLENYIPQFFRGTTKLYWDEVHFYKRINRNSFKPPVSEEVKAIVRQNFTREIEFYQFCKQRLHRQLRAIKLSNLAESDNFL